MTDHRKEWAEGLREALALAIYTQGAYCGDCEYDGWDSCADCRRCVHSYVDAVVAVVEPRVISLAEEVERLREALIRTTETGCDGAYEGGCAEEFDGIVGNYCQACLAVLDAAAALSSHPSEPEA